MKIFQGTSGNDHLVVSQLAGAQAFDWLQGLAGDDSFLLDGPMLFVWPGAGNDRVETTSFGGLWVVYLDSPAGIDYSEADGRILDGWGGTDTLIGATGGHVDGSEFADRFVFSSGNVRGMGGDDTITMGGRFSGVEPGAGNDTVFDVGTFDLVSYVDSPGLVSGDLAGGTVRDGWGGVDRLVGVTRLSLPAAGSDLTGSARDETFIVSHGGHHRLDGAGGQDRVEWSAARAEVTFSLLPGGWVEARQRTSGGVLTLRDVETLKFADASVDLTQPLNFTGHDFYAFASEPMPSLSSFYAMFPSPSGISAPTLIPVDLDDDGRLEIVLQLWQTNLVLGSSDLGPVPNRLIVLSQDGHGDYQVATDRFIAPGVDGVLSGAARQNQVGDVNGDGRPDIAFATNKEDGRKGDGHDPATDNNAQADVLLSDPATGLYRIASFGVSNWNHATTLAPALGPWRGLVVTAGFVTPPTVVAFGATTTTSLGPADMNAGTLRHLPWLDDAATGTRYFYADAATPQTYGGVPALWAWHPDGRWSQVARLDPSRYEPFGLVQFTSWQLTTGPSVTLTFLGHRSAGATHDTTALWHAAPGAPPLLVSKLNLVELIDPNATVVSMVDGSMRPLNFLDFIRFDRTGLAFESVPVRDEQTTLSANFIEALDLDRDGYEDLVVYAYREGGQPVVYLNDTRGGLFNAHLENFLPRAPDDWGQDASAKFLDADGDGLLDLLFWPTGQIAGRFAQQGAQYQLNLAQAALGTGPGHANGADLGAPGFNEEYYLGTYVDARKAVDAGLYPTGLAHYQAVGRAQGDFGFAPDVWVHGSAGADEIVLREGDERAEGLDGDDRFYGARGDDTIDGGAGTDTARYAGARAGYTIAKTAGHWVVTDRLGIEGTDTLTSIETLQFADRTFALANPPLGHAPNRGQDPGFLFDAAYYLLANPQKVPAVSLDGAAADWFASGAAQHLKPNSWFDASYYSAKWADLAPLRLDDATLFMHYNLYGVWEGRSAGPKFDHFDGARYLADWPDVAAYVDANLPAFLGSRTNGAIAHYVIYGANEQRSAYDTSGGAVDLGYVV
ncbi:MAG: hypothetical protein U1E86_06730 [Burkholderiaceae bacterium]